MANPLDAEQTSTGTPLFDALIEFFKTDDWPFVQLEGRPILSLNFDGKNGKWPCFAQARDEQQQFIFYSVCPINAPAEKRAALAEFITRANYGLIIGNFELDFEDGEVRYKTSLDAEGLTLNPALFKNLVYANVAMMDQYLPGLMSILYSEVSAREMIAQIED
jgi:hypothetical protein